MDAVRIGIFGGTFNPIHLGHLLLAETARETLKLDRVLFITTRQPPHKRVRDLLAGPERLALVQAAIQNHPAFVASDIELQRTGPSYSIDTVRLLRQQLPTAKLFLLVGEDMLGVRWLAWDELKRLCTIVAARRPGAAPSRRQRGMTPPPAPGWPRPTGSRGDPGRRSRPGPGGGVTWLPMPQMEISSSDIRARLKAGRSIRYLVPPAVERHIRQHHLYQASGPGVES